MKVRVSKYVRIGDSNPHPALSLAKGEAEEGSGMESSHFDSSFACAINFDLNSCNDRSKPIL